MPYVIVCPCGTQIYTYPKADKVECLRCGRVYMKIPFGNWVENLWGDLSYLTVKPKNTRTDDKHAIEQVTYKKAAIATVKKLAQVMCGPAYEFERTLNEYKEYLIRTYHLENEFPKGQSED